jgi:antitoxin MazE
LTPRAIGSGNWAGFHESRPAGFGATCEARLARGVYAGYYPVLTSVERGARVIKKLTAVGNSLGFIIERPILELLNITKDTPLDVSTDGEALIIRPVTRSKMDRVIAAADELMDAHEETFRKLAK